jgi:hypothetical protein
MKNGNQYIPKFYINNFSNNNSNQEIGVYNICKGEFAKNIQLGSQIQNPYSFGIGCVIEEWLRNVESTTDLYFSDIIYCNTLPDYSVDYFEKLIYFILLFELRNPSEAKLVDKSLNLLISEIPTEKRMSNDCKNEYKIPNGIDFSILDKSLDCCKDLKTKLIINRTSIPFITSDKPVVRYNQFLENFDFSGEIVSYGIMGLQIFIPISPNHLLFFYDDGVYNVGTEEESRFFVESEIDIIQFNLLQFLNAKQCLYFNETFNTSLFSEMNNSASKFIKAEKRICEDIASLNEIRTGMNLSFVTKKTPLDAFQLNQVQIPKRELVIENMRYWC